MSKQTRGKPNEGLTDGCNVGQCVEHAETHIAMIAKNVAMKGI